MLLRSALLLAAAAATAHGAAHLKTIESPVKLADILGEWQSAQCEVANPASNGVFWMREFSFTVDNATKPDEASWTAKFSFFNDSECKNLIPPNAQMQYNPYASPKEPFGLRGPSKNRGAGTADASFNLAYNQGIEYDIVNLQGEYLFLGARPLDGSYLTAEEKRPISLAPPLVKKGQKPVVETNADSVVGEWGGPCTFNTPFNFTTGRSDGPERALEKEGQDNPLGYRKDFFAIGQDWWKGHFAFFADDQCKGFKGDGTPDFVFATGGGLEFTGQNPHIHNALNAEFGLPEAFCGGNCSIQEYDFVFRTGDVLALGARPIQGGFMFHGPHDRPHSLNSFLTKSPFPTPPESKTPGQAAATTAATAAAVTTEAAADPAMAAFAKDMAAACAKGNATKTRRASHAGKSCRQMKAMVEMEKIKAAMKAKNCGAAGATNGTRTRREAHLGGDCATLKVLMVAQEAIVADATTAPNTAATEVAAATTAESGSGAAGVTAGAAAVVAAVAAQLF